MGNKSSTIQNNDTLNLGDDFFKPTPVINNIIQNLPQTGGFDSDSLNLQQALNNYDSNDTIGFYDAINQEGGYDSEESLGLRQALKNASIDIQNNDNIQQGGANISDTSDIFITSEMYNMLMKKGGGKKQAKKTSNSDTSITSASISDNNIDKEDQSDSDSELYNYQSSSAHTDGNNQDEEDDQDNQDDIQLQSSINTSDIQMLSVN